MMGERIGTQEALFSGFSLEGHVPPDHMLRSIDRFVDLGDIRERLKPFYSDIGRPSIDPELMLRMLIVGYVMGIRSERRLCDEVHLNLAYRWFCRLGLDGAVPNHSTFSKNRHGRFRDSDVLRQLFEAIVIACMAQRLVGGEAFAVDASMVRADANRKNGHDNGNRPPARLRSETIWQRSMMPPSVRRRRLHPRSSHRSTRRRAGRRRTATARTLHTAPTI